MDQQRTNFRLRYPEQERPLFKIIGRNAHVAELSERGARIRGLERVVPGQPLAGVIHFANGEVAEVDGKVLRRDGEEVVVRFNTGVSLKFMMSEQMRLICKYPQIRDQKTSPTEDS
jgi:hypothetical protein